MNPLSLMKASRRCVLLAWLAAMVSAAGATAEKPHIIYILADDLGSYDVGWRGSEIKTPNLDNLAQGGATLEQFYVQPVCSPTRAALLTGRYPMRHGLQVGVVRPWADYGLPLEERTLPQALREAGYRTAIFGKWHLGHARPEYLPTRRGFDHQYGHYNGAIDYFDHSRDGGHDWHQNDKINRDEGYSTTLIGREAARFIAGQDGKKPLFVYVPFNAPHTPLQVPEKYMKAYAHLPERRAMYAGMITAMDDAVGEIVAALEKKNWRTNTLIVFSSDNGGASPGKLSRNGPLRDGKFSLYEGGVRVCAFANWPGKIKAGSAVEAPIHIVDWYPTLLNLGGAPRKQELPVDGRDCWAVVTGQGGSTRGPILINAAPNNGAIRAGDWKLVLNGSLPDGERSSNRIRSEKPPAVELFNLADDLGEKKNLAASHPEKVRVLRAQYDDLARQQAPIKLKPKPDNFKSPAVWGE